MNEWTWVIVKQLIMAMTVAVTFRSRLWNVPMSEYLLDFSIIFVPFVDKTGIPVRQICHRQRHPIEFDVFEGNIPTKHWGRRRQWRGKECQSKIGHIWLNVDRRGGRKKHFGTENGQNGILKGIGALAWLTCWKLAQTYGKWRNLRVN